MPLEPISLGGASCYPASQCAPVEVSEQGLHLYVNNPRVIELPEEGCITFRFRRGPVTIVGPSRHGPGTASADLTLTEICEVEKSEAEEYEKPTQLEGVIDELFSKLVPETPEEE